MLRRDVLTAAGRTMAAALSASIDARSAVFAQDRSSLSDALQRRLADIVAAYDAQGNHRTATPADHASAEWLASLVRQAGAEPTLEPFALLRIDPRSCHLRVADRRIDGVPVFDAAFTAGEGLQGRLGPLGSEAGIGLAETEPFTLMEPRKEQAGPLAQARHSSHKAVVLLTRGSRPGLYLLNALSFAKPFGPPMLQVSSAESEWLKDQARQRAETTFVAEVGRSTAQAFNVTAKIAGKDPTLAPLVVMTPYSGWWQCASERGGGLACWLEAMRTLAAAKTERDCLFVACSGHEIGFLGFDSYIKARPDLIGRAQAWIYFGGNIGAPQQPNLIHASDDALERWVVGAMAKEGLIVNAKAERGSVPRGEIGAAHRAGGRYVDVLCGTDVFHNAADRWPDAVDVAVLGRYASAFANGALELARQRG